MHHHLLTGMLLCAVPAAVHSTRAADVFSRPRVAADLLSHPRSSDWPPDGRIVAYANPRGTDGVEILSITSRAVAADGPQDIIVRVRYSLFSAPKALVSVGFNLGSPTRFLMLNDRWVQAGRGEMEFPVRVDSNSWPRDGRAFRACVNLSTAAHPTAQSTLASQVRPLKIK